MARADARGHGTGRRTGLWHGPTHGARARADERGPGTGRHTGPGHGPTHGAMGRADTRGHGTGRRTGPWHGPTHASPVHVRASSETSYSACVHAVIPNPRSR